eukprot:gene12964-biopygen948
MSTRADQHFAPGRPRLIDIAGADRAHRAERRETVVRADDCDDPVLLGDDAGMARDVGGEPGGNPVRGLLRDGGEEAARVPHEQGHGPLPRLLPGACARVNNLSFFDDTAMLRC